MSQLNNKDTMFDGGELSASDSEFFTTNFNHSNDSALNKKDIITTKKRFSDDQIRSLEVMFESESKLEPRKKLQLARELGLQPRQVAIWFQNKRARYKSKQLERDYNILMANYNTLNSQFEALKKEKESLILQLKKLHDLMGKSRDEGQQVQAIARNSGGGGSGSSSSDVKSENIGEREDGKWVASSYSDEDDSSIIKSEYLGVYEEAAIAALNGGSFESNENWAILESDGLLDHCTPTTTSSTSSSYQWWDFWSCYN